MKYSKFPALLVIALVVPLSLLAPSEAVSKTKGQQAKLKTVSAEIQRVLDGIGIHLKGAAKRLGKRGISGTEAETILDDLCRKHPYFTSCATVDLSGVIRTNRPEHNRKYEGKDISDQEHIKKLIGTNQPAMSGLFKAVEGYHAVEFGWPVFDGKGNFVGAVSAVVRPREFLAGIIEPKLSWDVFTIWVLQTDGTALFSQDRSLEGEDLDEVVHYTKNFQYKPLLDRIEKESSGSMRYLKEGVGRSAPKPRKMLWDSVEFRDGRWRIVLIGPLQ